jgi:CelD/BcsL family acetyltransferase involved in cellulose biosynthesis
MQVYRTSRLDELIPIANCWNGLAGGIPFRRFEWLGTWWQHYFPAMLAAGRQVELFTLCVVDQDELVGVAPCYIDRSRTSGSVIRFLGSGQVCSDYLGILSKPGLENDVASAIAEWLIEREHVPKRDHDHWDLLELESVDAHDSAMRLLADRMQECGTDVHCHVAGNTWQIELPASMPEFLTTLSKSHRKQLRQFKRRCFDTGFAVLRTAESPADLERAWCILGDLHQRRMTSLGKIGCFQSDTFSRFLRDVTNHLARAGILRLHWLEFHGRPIAAEYHLLGEKFVFAYQGGIDPEALQYEPGRLITLATLELAIREGHRVFDFCRGDESYKAHWRARPRPTVTWRIVCNRASSRLRHNLWCAGQKARGLMRDGLKLAAGKGASL